MNSYDLRQLPKIVAMYRIKNEERLKEIIDCYKKTILERESHISSMESTIKEGDTQIAMLKKNVR